MSDTVFFDDVSDEVRAAAQNLVAGSSEGRGAVMEEMNDQPALREPVNAFTERLIRDLAAGRHPIYTTSDDELSPAEAARVLGLSRQYVDRLIADGRLPFGHKLGSTHRTISCQTSNASQLLGPSDACTAMRRLQRFSRAGSSIDRFRTSVDPARFRRHERPLAVSAG